MILLTVLAGRGNTELGIVSHWPPSGKFLLVLTLGAFGDSMRIASRKDSAVILKLLIK